MNAIRRALFRLMIVVFFDVTMEAFVVLSQYIPDEDVHLGNEFLAHLVWAAEVRV